MIPTLIVDDEALIRNLITHSIDFSALGFAVVGEAENGPQALHMIDMLSPHLIILDINIPLLNGIELARIVRERFPATKILILTGYGEFEYAKKLIRIGVSDYLLKPIDPPAFAEVLLRIKSEIEQERARNQYMVRLERDADDSTELLKKVIVHSQIAPHINEILPILRGADRPRFSDLIGLIRAQVGQQYPAIENAYVIYAEIATEIMTFVWENNLKTEDVLPGSERYIEALRLNESLDALSTWVETLGLTALDVVSGSSKSHAEYMVAQARQFIDQHFQEPNLSVEEIAERIFINPSYLSKLFKQVMNCSLIEYLTELRLKHAKAIMDTKSYLHIGAVSQAVGYRDPFYFSKLFKRAYGTSPSTYLQRKQR